MPYLGSEWLRSPLTYINNLATKGNPTHFSATHAALVHEQATFMTQMFSPDVDHLLQAFHLF